MTTDPTDPDWSLLPGDPAGFFALALEFERGDLKRQYGKLIRRFKPEQFPAEFQRIRAAYEMLDVQLRYGSTAVDSTVNGEYKWQTDSPAHIEAITDGVTTPLHDRLATEPPATLYRELSSRSHKSPYDYFALALLSDVVEPNGDIRFASWIFAGISEWPQDNGLRHLLHHFLYGRMSSGSLPEVLFLAAQHIPEQHFYPYTEHLWLLLLRKRGFACFRETLDRCAQFQREINIGTRVVFYLQILRHAIWQADSEWVARMIAFVEENFQYIPPQLDREIDLLLTLQEYTAGRDKFIAGHPLRATMDKVLCSYFTEGEVTGDEQMIACQLKILEDPSATGHAFPDCDDPMLRIFYSLWAWTSRDAADRNLGESKPAQPDEVWRSQAHALVKRADTLANWSGLGIKWNLARLAFFLTAGPFTIFGIPIFLTLATTLASITIVTSRKHQDAVVGLGAIAAVVIGVYLGFRACAYVKRRIIDPFDARMARRCGNLLWRPAVIAFLRRSHLSVPILMNFILSAAPTPSRERFYTFIERDYALAFYSIAQRFLS